MSASQERSTAESLRRLWPTLRPFRWLMLLAVLGAGMLTILGMLPPLIMRPLINDVAADGQWGLFPLLIGGLFAITVFRALMTYINARTVAFVGQRIVGRVRLRLFRHSLRLPLRYHERTPVGGLMQRLMGDVGAIQNLVTGHLITLCVDIITAVFAITVLLQLNWKLTLFTLALMPVFYLNYRFWIGRIKLNNVQMRSEMDHVSSLLQERLSSHDLVASYAREEDSVVHFRDRVRASRDTAIRGIVYNLGFNHVTQFANATGNTLIFAGAVYFYIEGTMEYGDVIAFGAYATQLLGPIVRFVKILQAVAHSMVSIRRIDEVMEHPTEPTGAPLATAPPRQGTVNFANYTYRDPDTGTTILDDLSLTVPPATNLHLVGPPGSGKSTLLSALRRMIDPDDGALTLNGVDLREFNPHGYRRSVPMVRDTSGIFRGTIRSNLAYGKPNATEEEMRTVLNVVGLEEFLGQLEAGLDTPVGPGGIRLSSGQRQRLGVARAILLRPPMLILDEATAALDPESAATLIDAVADFLPQTTIFTVTRRLGGGAEEDHVAVVEQGRVVESGIRSELMARPESEYRRLFEQQYGKDAAEKEPESPAKDSPGNGKGGKS